MQDNRLESRRMHKIDVVSSMNNSINSENAILDDIEIKSDD